MQTQTTYMLPVVTAGMTKSQIQLAASNAVDGLLENGNILEAAEAMSVMENFIKQVKDHNQFVPTLREELSKYGKGLTTASGAKIEVAETGTKYDYSKCEDLLLQSMTAQLTELSEKIKARETMLKTLPLEGILFTDESTGETYKVYPPSKTSTSSYKITLAK